MFVKKQRITQVLCLVAFLAFLPIPKAIAAEVNTDSEYTEIMPLLEYIYDADYSFAISDGKAIMYAVVRGQSAEATKCEVTVELQEKRLLFWDTVECWTATEYGSQAELDISHKVTTGKSYRMVTMVTVWSGTDVETKTMTSETLIA